MHPIRVYVLVRFSEESFLANKLMEFFHLIKFLHLVVNRHKIYSTQNLNKWCLTEQKHQQQDEKCKLAHWRERPVCVLCVYAVAETIDRCARGYVVRAKFTRKASIQIHWLSKWLTMNFSLNFVQMKKRFHTLTTQIKF